MSNKSSKISAIIIKGGFIDKELYKRCLNSLDWVNDIVVVETDNLKGSFADWRNEGIKKSKNDWLIYIDTDEEVSDNLKNEIEKEISNTKFSAYAIPRKNFIFNKEFKHSGQYPDYQKRLFKKESFKEWTGEVHEEPIFDGSLGHLENPIIHHKNITLNQMVDKTNKWSEIESKLMFDAHHPPMNFFRFCSAGLREFWLRMVVQMAFLDGTEGIIYALYQVYSKLISYSKLWELQLKNTK